MTPLLILKLSTVLVTATGISVGSYFLTQHLSKSKEKKEKTPAKPATTGTAT